MDHPASNLAAPDFLAGVIEGFYGEPWTQGERFALFDWMTRWGLNTYLYAPKDDLNHRVLWREVYSTEAEQHLGQLIRACAPGRIRFIYGLGPGLTRVLPTPRSPASLTSCQDSSQADQTATTRAEGSAEPVFWEAAGRSPASFHIDS